MKIYQVIICDLIELRKKSGLTQKGLADKSGVAQAYISLLEKEERTCSSEVWDRIKIALDE